jgi:hypothetical protein
MEAPFNIPGTSEVTQSKSARNTLRLRSLIAPSLANDFIDGRRASDTGDKDKESGSDPDFHWALTILPSSSSSGTP